MVSFIKYLKKKTYLLTLFSRDLYRKIFDGHNLGTQVGFAINKQKHFLTFKILLFIAGQEGKMRQYIHVRIHTLIIIYKKKLFNRL